MVKVICRINGLGLGPFSVHQIAGGMFATGDWFMQMVYSKSKDWVFDGC